MDESFEGKVARTIERNYSGNDSEVLFSRLKTSEIKQQVCELVDKIDNSPTSDDEEVSTLPMSREGMEALYDTQLEAMQEVTPISYGNQPAHYSEQGIAFQSAASATGERFTTKQLSIIEAHEKGHLIRPYEGPRYDEYFRRGFDIARVDVTDDWLKTGKRILATQLMEASEEDIDLKAARRAVIDYLFSGTEIAERMNQLKN